MNYGYARTYSAIVATAATRADWGRYESCTVPRIAVIHSKNPLIIALQ